jgi:hypothetical protein
MVADDDETFQKRHKLHPGQQVLFRKKKKIKESSNKPTNRRKVARKCFHAVRTKQERI